MTESAISRLLEHYFSPISELLETPGVTNIYVNSHDSVYYERHGQILESPSCWPSPIDLHNAIHTLANSLKQPLDPSRPLLDARLPDGTRINAVLQPIVQTPTVSIRVFPKTTITGDKLVEYGALRKQDLAYLIRAVKSKKNILISGCVDSGKTTLLRILIDAIPAERRLLCIEDTSEIYLDPDRHHNFVQLEAAKRTANKVTMSTLIENSLRMSPQSLVLGEIRDSASAVALRTVLNTGTQGIMATLHANTCEETILRLSDLICMENEAIDYSLITTSLRRNIDVLVNCTYSDKRQVREILELQPTELQIFKSDQASP